MVIENSLGHVIFQKHYSNLNSSIDNPNSFHAFLSMTNIDKTKFFFLTNVFIYIFLKICKNEKIHNSFNSIYWLIEYNWTEILCK